MFRRVGPQHFRNTSSWFNKSNIRPDMILCLVPDTKDDDHSFPDFKEQMIDLPGLRINQMAKGFTIPFGFWGRRAPFRICFQGGDGGEKGITVSVGQRS